MVVTIFLVVLIAVLVLLTYAATRPNQFRLERQTTVVAPANRVFSLIDDFKQWQAWSPWEGLDPELRRTYSGSEHGKGAAYAWEGNSKVGAGRMTIVESHPDRRVTVDLEFIRPFTARNTAVFTLEPHGNAIDVTWAMFGPAPFMRRVMGIFLNFDSLIGKDFEKGLAQLKKQAEQTGASR